MNLTHLGETLTSRKIKTMLPHADVFQVLFWSILPAKHALMRASLSDSPFLNSPLILLNEDSTIQLELGRIGVSLLS